MGARSDNVAGEVRYCCGFSGGGASLSPENNEIAVATSTASIASIASLATKGQQKSRHQCALQLKQEMNDFLLMKCEVAAFENACDQLN